MTLKDFFPGYFNYLIQNGYCEKTIDEHRRMMKGALSHAYLEEGKPITEIDIGNINLADIGAVIAAGNAHGEYGKQRAVVVLRRILRYIHLKGELLPFDWRDIPLPKTPFHERRYLGPEEVHDFLEKIQCNSLRGLRLRAICEMLWGSGMRINEAMTMPLSQLDWKRKEAFIKGKGAVERYVYFSERAIKWLKKYLATRFDTLDVLFVNDQGTAPFPNATARKHLLELCQKLKLKRHITFHDFRAAFACALIKTPEGIQPATSKEVQKLLGHASFRTTNKYYILADQSHCREAHARIINALNS